MTENEFAAWYIGGLTLCFCAGFLWGHYAKLIQKLGTSA